MWYGVSKLKDAAQVLNGLLLGTASSPVITERWLEGRYISTDNCYKYRSIYMKLQEIDRWIKMSRVALCGGWKRWCFFQVTGKGEGSSGHQSGGVGLVIRRSAAGWGHWGVAGEKGRFRCWGGGRGANPLPICWPIWSLINLTPNKGCYCRIIFLERCLLIRGIDKRDCWS